MIGNFILSGRVQAIVVTTLSALVSVLMLPFAYLISGSVLGLITLRKGAAIGLQTLVLSLLLLQVFFVVASLPPQFGIAYAMVIWLPVWFASAVLRLSEQQGLLLSAVALLVISLIAAAYITIDDVAHWWQQWFDLMLAEAAPPERLEQYQELMKAGAPMVNSMMAIALMLNILIAVFCARWWQSRLFNLGAFRKEFYALHLPPVILPVSGIMILLVFTLGEQWQAMFRDITVILMFMYLIQGISSVHRNVDKLKLSTAWIGAMYCLLVLIPQMGLLIACLGMTDVYISWRRKKIGSENEL
ncbi:MAG TPA: DUF2232 domain-containing protein [Thiotrichaceae bacterium]|jgi:hypothetical protein|nr:DUF2232 domain-containing protein [Thiotrichaceae bacterium]HIM08472.1 DUF2232 domain-containing protein [Gammaproteobacteria bacterium]